MKRLRTILIDDETDSLNLLELLLRKCDKDIDVIGKFNDPREASKVLPLLKPDLLFLDIEMPRMTGFDLLETLPDQSCRVIFVTAHHQHALKAFRYNAIDYLLKPLQLSELQRALDKVSRSMPLSRQQWQSAQTQLDGENWSRIAVSGHNGIIFLELPDILYAEAINNYTKIFTLQGKQITTAKTLKDVQETLSDSMFIRIHRQFLVNLKHIRQFNRSDNSVTMTNGETLPVARSQKDFLLEKFKWL
jgi:two-component system LytT family response regulator